MTDEETKRAKELKEVGVFLNGAVETLKKCLSEDEELKAELSATERMLSACLDDLVMLYAKEVYGREAKKFTEEG